MNLVLLANNGNDNMFVPYRIICLLLVLLATSIPGSAQTSAVENTLDNPQLIGEGRLKILLWKVYDAALYSNTGTYDNDEPFALELTYLRAVKGKKIVDTTMDEIRRLATTDISVERLKEWRQQLDSTIPDMKAGMIITGVRTSEGYTEIYVNAEKIDTIDDPAFTDGFFAIWLSEKTSEPGLRTKLLGLDNGS